MNFYDFEGVGVPPAKARAAMKRLQSCLSRCSYGTCGKYEGAWRHDARHGCGVFTYPDGRKTAREYNEGVLVSELEQ